MFPTQVFAIFSIFTLSFVVDCSRLSCSRCRGYGVDFFPGQNTLKNKYLQGYNFTSMFVIEKAHCALSCIHDFCQCASLNFKEIPEIDGTHLCELNFETKGSVSSSSLVTTENYLYMDLVAESRVGDYTYF